MAGISGMREYIHMTARIISSVLRKEVVICNEKGMVLGDSIYEETADFEVYPVTEKSMLLDSMKKGLFPQVALKAVLTAQNCFWTFAQLFQELEEEHSHFYSE